MGDSQNRGKKYSLMYLGCLLIHVEFFALFFIEHKIVLSFIEAVLIISYLVLVVKARNAQRFVGLFITCSVNMIVSTISHVILLGPTMGFQYIYIAVVPIVFFLTYQYKRKIRRSLITSTCIGVLFLLNMIAVNAMKGPVFCVSVVTSRIISTTNMILYFCIAVGFMTLFVLQATSDTGTLMKANSSLRTTANVDALTGLRNRHSIDKCLEDALKSAKGEGRDFSILMCDIDNFKHVNDTYGHDCGDEVLKNVANQIMNSVRPEDIVFRFGGEEILILVAGGRFPAERVAERCRASIEESKVEHGDVTVKVTITIGVSSYYQGSTIDVLINKADENLYKGKKNGKNQVVV